MIHEETVNFGEGGSLNGIFTPTPVKSINGDRCVIFLNAGLIHKIGPNRIYKKLAGHFSGNGFTAFRMDFSGLGDSGFSNEKVSNSDSQINEVKMAMDWLQQNKGIDKFLLSGICSGAKVAWDVSRQDPRVIGLSLIDGIFADDQLLREVGGKANQQVNIRYYKKNMFSLTRWRKLLSGKSKVLSRKNIIAAAGLIGAMTKKYIRALSQKGTNKPVSHPLTVDRSDKIVPWRIMFERNVKIQLIFCEGGIAIDVYKLTLSGQLGHYQDSGVLRIEFVKDVDHTFTPVWSQAYLSDLTISWVKQEFKEEFRVLAY
jgi:hypothetical protein